MPGGRRRKAAEIEAEVAPEDAAPEAASSEHVVPPGIWETIAGAVSLKASAAPPTTRLYYCVVSAVVPQKTTSSSWCGVVGIGDVCVGCDDSKV